MAGKDYYAILGVARDASQDDIKKAFRKLAHKHHPDKEGGDEAKFKEANEAYGVLSDPEKRRRYDQFGSAFEQAGQGGFGGGAGGFDFNDFQFGGGAGGFEDVFSDLFGGGFGGARRGGPRAGSDIQVDVEITFDEMVSGTRKAVRIRKEMKCDECGGTGGKKGSKETKCSECGGSGRIRKAIRTVFGVMEQVVACPSCHGKGVRYEEKCPVCGGDGKWIGEEELTIDIPAGIDDSQVISVPGKGSAGEIGGVPGDLFVAVHVAQRKGIVRRGQNLFSEKAVSFPQAALGDTVSVETAYGAVKMKIPAGTQSGEVFRIRGKGLPSPHGFGQGDHMVTVRVEIPKRLSGEEKKILRGLWDSWRKE